MLLNVPTLQTQSLQLISNAENQTPYVKSRNLWGEKYPHDRLVTSEGWKRLGEWGIKNGYALNQTYWIFNSFKSV